MHQLIPERTLAALLDYSGRLAAALTVDAVAAVVVQEGRGAVGASRTEVALLESPSCELRVVAAGGQASGGSEAPSPCMTEAMRTGQPIYTSGSDASAALPLVAEERVIGAARFTFKGAVELPDRDRALVALVTRQAADALRRARLYAAEREARHEAESANRMKDDFLATLSHELRTPLNAILGWAHLLRHGSLDAPTSEGALDTILRNAHAQSQLVEDVLDVSRIVTGRLRIHLRPVDLRGVIRQALDAVAPSASARHVRLESISAAGDAVVAGDADRLRQVVWNLLSNAVKFTPPDGHVELRLDRTTAGYELTVTDTGAGIPPEFLPRAFDHFSQADASTRRAHGGLGLGLSIVRHLVELHGGTVEAWSEGEGRGTRLTVRLPAAAAPERAGPTVSGSPADRPRQGSVDLRGVRVLVVDGDADVCEGVVSGLRAHGAHVVHATTSAEALERLADSLPNVLIADQKMAGEGGYELIRLVRALPLPAGHVPAIALAASGTPEERSRCLLLGYQEYIPKPVVLADLIDAVERLMSRRPAVQP